MVGTMKKLVFGLLVLGVILCGVTAEDAEPKFKPATGPRQFSVNVDDNIRGANQHRQEKWNNGTVTGSYVSPGRQGKWLKYEYIGDKNGFRITSVKEVSPEQLMGGTAAGDKSANVNIQHDDSDVKYTVTANQLKENKKSQEADGKSTSPDTVKEENK